MNMEISISIFRLRQKMQNEKNRKKCVFQFIVSIVNVLVCIYSSHSTSKSEIFVLALFSPLLSLLPWLPIFVDRLTKQTIIYSPTGGSKNLVFFYLLKENCFLFVSLYYSTSNQFLWSTFFHC